MFPHTQRVDYQQGHAFETRHHVVGNRLGIGDVGQRADTVAQNGQIIVHHGNGFHPHTLDQERLALLDNMFLELSDTRVRIVSKAIGYALVQIVQHVGTGINGHWPFKAIGPHVVQSRHMVKMDVCQQHCIQVIVAGT